MQWLLLLGVATGMRTMTAVAVLCWFAWLGRTPMHGWAFWAAHPVSVVVFSVLALGEYFGDTRPQAPNRTDLGPALARLVFGGVAGALAANAIHQPAAGGIVFGAIGSLIGTWGGFRVRIALAARLRRDLPAALLESAFAVALALWAAHHVAKDVAQEAVWWSRPFAQACRFHLSAGAQL